MEMITEIKIGDSFEFIVCGDVALMTVNTIKQRDVTFSVKGLSKAVIFQTMNRTDVNKMIDANLFKRV